VGIPKFFGYGSGVKKSISTQLCNPVSILNRIQKFFQTLSMPISQLTSDVVETVTFDTETETWLKFREEAETSSKIQDRESRLEVRDRDSRLQNLCILPKFKKNIAITTDLNFLQISDIFRRVLVVSYLQIQQISSNHRNFNKPFLCHIKSLETWSPRDRDSQKWVSRPRASLETPSLQLTLQTTMYLKLESLWPIWLSKCRQSW